MTEYTIIGIRAYSFDSKTNGRRVEGLTLFVTYLDRNVDGLASDKFSLSYLKYGGYTPKIGDVITINYNRYGKVDNIAFVE